MQGGPWVAGDARLSSSEVRNRDEKREDRASICGSSLHGLIWFRDWPALSQDTSLSGLCAFAALRDIQPCSARSCTPPPWVAGNARFRDSGADGRSPGVSANPTIAGVLSSAARPRTMKPRGVHGVPAPTAVWSALLAGASRRPPITDHRSPHLGWRAMPALVWATWRGTNE